MQRQNLVSFIGFFVCIGVPNRFREIPYFFFGELIEVTQETILLKLHKDGGFKSIRIEEILDIHKDRKFSDENRRRNGG